MATDAEPMETDTGCQLANQQDCCQQYASRCLLRFVAAAETPPSARTLATHLTQTRGTAPAAHSTAQRRRTLARVRHVYLPRLETQGLITTDTQRETIALTARGARLVASLSDEA